VKAKLPHGIEAIKQHLKEVDNVPLLVSLFTDSTPATITEMVDIFRDHGEIVMTLGSSYRSHNQAIYTHSDIAISVDMLPSELSHLSSSSNEIISKYPVYNSSGLSQTDLSFVFRLVGLQTCAILQAPCPLPAERQYSGSCSQSCISETSKLDQTGEEANLEVNPLGVSSQQQEGLENEKEGGRIGEVDTSAQFVPSMDLLESVGAFQSQDFPSVTPCLAATTKDKEKNKHLNLRSLMEAIRTGRVFLLNAQQCLGFICVALNITGLWSLYCQAVPLSVAPVIAPFMLILFVCIYIPGKKQFICHS
jgi:hypothetical protein